MTFPVPADPVTVYFRDDAPGSSALAASNNLYIGVQLRAYQTYSSL